MKKRSYLDQGQEPGDLVVTTDGVVYRIQPGGYRQREAWEALTPQEQDQVEAARARAGVVLKERALRDTDTNQERCRARAANRRGQRPTPSTSLGPAGPGGAPQR